MWTRLASALLVAGSLLVAVPARTQGPTASGSPFAAAVAIEPTPAPEDSAQPFLAVDRTGRVRLSWLARRAGGGHRLQFAEYQGSGWSAPATIADGPGLVANWADVPSIHATATGTLMAHWVERGEHRGSTRVRLSRSTDGGRTWSPAGTPHQDSGAGEHGFASFFEGPGATAGVVWLDGRLVAERGRGGAMSLRAATLEPGGAGEDVLVDPRVCDCCPTAATRIDGGAIVAYRDRSDDEIRDISVVRLVNGKWTAPVTVAADQWQINACPVSGPAIAASGRSVAVAWFTVAGGAGRVKVAFSSDGGQTFSHPAVAETENAVGRLGLIMPEADRVVLSSIERVNGADRLTVREARRHGRVGAPTVVAATTLERTSGFPRLAASGRRVWLAWTDVVSGGSPQVRVASARLK